MDEKSCITFEDERFGVVIGTLLCVAKGTGTSSVVKFAPLIFQVFSSFIVETIITMTPPSDAIIPKDHRRLNACATKPINGGIKRNPM
jgi:hypothetical protein